MINKWKLYWKQIFENFDENLPPKLNFYDVSWLSSFTNLAEWITNNLKLIGLTQIQINNLELWNNKIWDLVINKINDSVPDGIIVPFSGSEWNIPKGWFMCDGNNGTPNLQGRFIYGFSGNPSQNLNKIFQS